MINSLCFLCAQVCNGSGVICWDCQNDLPFNSKACPACARPNSNSTLCANCLRKPWQFIDNTWSLFTYHYPINHLIKHMKFKRNFHICRHLGKLLTELLIKSKHIPPECIIPVPLHYSKLVTRGYNQSVELAKPIANQLGIKLELNLCKRIRATPPQFDLPPKKRRKNVLNAFSMNTKKTSYSHVLLIDDIITTGSTINELSRILHNAGISKIDSLVCARTAFPDL